MSWFGSGKKPTNKSVIIKLVANYVHIKRQHEYAEDNNAFNVSFCASNVLCIREFTRHCQHLWLKPQVQMTNLIQKSRDLMHNLVMMVQVS